MAFWSRRLEACSMARFRVLLVAMVYFQRLAAHVAPGNAPLSPQFTPRSGRLRASIGARRPSSFPSSSTALLQWRLPSRRAMAARKSRRRALPAAPRHHENHSSSERQDILAEVAAPGITGLRNLFPQRCPKLRRKHRAATPEIPVYAHRSSDNFNAAPASMATVVAGMTTVMSGASHFQFPGLASRSCGTMEIVPSDRLARHQFMVL